MNPYITFQHFSFKYDAQNEPTLKNLNLTIKKGEKVLILGPSGSGKSTLGQCLNGIIPNHIHGEHTGDLLIDGQSIFEHSIYEKSQLISTVLQDTDGQFIGLSVAEDIAFALENDALEQDEMKTKIRYWSEKLDLLQLLEHRPQDLSGGQKQRVSLAGVLVDESPILLFDEPLANLDPKSGQDTIDLIDQIHQDTSATTIIIEHRLEDVLYRSVDKIILINDGQILFDGKPDDILKTRLLSENGIREPLYITVLRDLGLDIINIESLSHIDTLDLSEITLQTSIKTKNQEKPKEVLLEVKNLNFSYTPNTPILNGIDLTIFQGERISIVGQNGAGKSTLAKALCRFVDASAEMSFKGQDISQDSIKERADRIGYVLQNPNQMISQPMIFDEVAQGLRLRGLPEEEVKEKVFDTLKVCGLYPFRNWPVSALSFGQKKRVTIASILVLGAEIIILDEPTAGQDKKNYTDIMNFLDELNQRGHTIIMITHDMQLMMEYSDRTIVINQGTVLCDDIPEKILSDVDILEQAHLKKTSLFYLAEKITCDPVLLTHYYIQKERGRHG
ncbi:ABC transporter ATP-binding protein [Streptococcus sp. CSL10205-OR2]|uniref:ABC transporter ATP-binding protein n=1 Tax=Streptococcus sp. CSL10205-OR2 TaxID=2980558 RepID=UPI0021D7FFD1|nr:ABC transporter ATP-binding protein [Streptococcus sp. CSL10205-OR2]MCU9534398.1 ABC transporter ATP-binding protein [Streptococcus sp. CSL10205-OR2]